MLHRHDPDSCVVLGGNHSIYPMKELQLLRIMIAVLLYRILAIQQTQLPSNAVPLGCEREFTFGTTITVIMMEDSVIKRVDPEQQPHLIDKLAALQQLYRATKVGTHLIRSTHSHQIHSHFISLW